MKLSVFASASAVALLAAGSALASGSVSTVNQSSSSDVAYVDQVGATNGTANITQTTHNDFAKIYQSDGAGGTGATSTILQGASGGPAAFTFQNGSGASVIDQTAGGHNQATVYQDGPANARAKGSYATVTQSGYHDVVGRVDTSASATGVSGLNGDPGIYQYGNYNFGGVVQAGNHDTASISQNSSVRRAPGSTDDCCSSDANAYFNYATIQQLGDGDRADVTQIGDNTAEVSQLGDNETAHVLQSGYANFARVWQQPGAAGSQGTISTYGHNNNAYIYQASGSNSAFINQGLNGADVYGNTATINQTGCDNIGTINQLTNNNIADLTQSGFSNTAVISQ
ncbi:hypothetical protein DJ021_14800 [Phenylobacterium hankyongense]|uniref:Curlin n=1 Tax=Phenylobacterium hankyongense TaxID=1813876 RepID=A0A328B4Y5_9CAUL|nr:hypothetical protein [Phenylobacterium hankyongense]RAK60986.1 hypothetical protein DJ021_14800 [Phenylobacterium hankyongense]